MAAETATARPPGIRDCRKDGRTRRTRAIHADGARTPDPSRATQRRGPHPLKRSRGVRTPLLASPGAGGG